MTFDYSDFVRTEYHDRLAGKRIKEVKPMTPEERDAYGWLAGYDVPVVIIFDDGDFMVPMCDPEGNGPGALDIYTKDGPR